MAWGPAKVLLREHALAGPSCLLHKTEPGKRAGNPGIPGLGFGFQGAYATKDMIAPNIPFVK